MSGKGPELEVVVTKGTGRGVVATEFIPRQSFVCEYKTSRIVTAGEREKLEERHEQNGIGCYMVDVVHPVPGHGRIVLDSSEKLHNPGRYINHVARKPNIRPWPLMDVRGKLSS